MLATRMRYGGKVTLAAASVTFNTAPTAYDSTKVASHSFASVSIGTANAARRVVIGVVIGGGSETASGTINSVTCNGDAMTLIKVATPGNCSIAICDIAESAMSSPTDTTATIVVGSSGTFGFAQIFSYRVLAYGATVSQSVTSTSNGSPISLIPSNMSTVANNAVVGVFGISSNDGEAADDADVAWTTQMTDADQDAYTGNGSGENAACASDIFASANTTFSQRLTCVLATGASHTAMAAVSWAPNT